ncbi:ribosomal protein L15 [Cladophialophora bantiana CBS 173.52]|uniref:Ribosomal protein L15 n=1 Tax=Cladophialophora bantiana (strain ATCC 10958 / CBS 173.52 / CDC B-1940 / NIH 8579) TaxID=1442370 RepID=A0A0D2H3F6_CLAB1|nr:ribosomal protein L15 [Cladophialophora bantiana CBS 173.52]KIW87848.1 ribosomal protein L15 [Cladophialophora bantiana CBS 173.52]
MPPRLPLRLSPPKILRSSIIIPTPANANSSIPALFLPSLVTQSQTHHQRRYASILTSLSDRPGAYNKKIRRGRGPASGKGGKSGRGSDGQKQHSKVPAGFNGGQTPEHIVHGKYGFKNLFANEMSPINLDKIQSWIDQGRLDPSRPITLKELCSSRVLGRVKDGVKLLGNGASELKTPIHIVVSRASQSAIAAVEALGGTVTTRFYTAQAIRRIKSSQTHPFLSLRWDPVALKNPNLAVEGSELVENRARGMGFPYRLPDPSSRKELEYYRDAKHRGYLSHLVKGGESASLYFKPPITEEELKALKRESARGGRAAKRKEGDKLW